MAHLLYKTMLVVGLLLFSTGGLYDYAHYALSTSPFTQHAIYVPSRVTPKDLQCLTRVIYYEAGNQSRAGKEAVAIVVLNRVVNPRYPNSICGVINQAYFVNEHLVCQFSFHCEPHRKVNREIWNQSYTLAKRVLTNTFDRDILTRVEDAVYFHANYVRPSWAKQKVLVATIDNHLFYKEPRHEQSIQTSTRRF